MKITAFETIDSVSPAPAKAGKTIRQIATRVARALKAWSDLRRDRREIAQMGPRGRRELHTLLLARGEGGLSLDLWPAWQREADALACDADAFAVSLRTAQATAVIRSVAR